MSWPSTAASSRSDVCASRTGRASPLKLVPVSQVLFGTDFPFRTSGDHVKGLPDYGFSATDLRAIDRDNAARLRPRFRA